MPARADGLRLATWNAELTRFGPGLLLRSLSGTKDPQAAAAVTVIGALDADVLLITGIDFDARGQAAQALADRLAKAGHPYPYTLALRPNTGIATGLDLDDNGKRGEARDSQGFGRFAGQAGMAVLSRLPILADQAQDYSAFLWRDLPGTLMPPDTPPEVAAAQRLSTSGHWAVPVRLPDGRALTLLAWHATPPVFDGPEDRNGRRNHDEAAFWLHLLAGDLPFAAPQPPYALLGQSNLDPADGEGLPAALVALLASPRLQDPSPRGTNPRSDAGQYGDPDLDTALYDGIGGLRVEVILPSPDLTVTASGILWPPDDDPLSPALQAASHHRPVWVDLQP
ncbi:endonuclease/exonuclease/phosphatase family protein [Fuscibacter oryzae]|uniref:Endonuclease/exonuclease/phosphatase family protein n=1 Tax=Fuscibacter oryzae TaxID=2803939 RepID=A0A8J7SUY7_9RHOB|nr:endonuclease/exonuclease/phosphatase family protein [Fuscibacter oryzae]MBL4930125.1 endonuclease/exonuclease/phosphatase family protein [Fuscibacter oryzae]